MDDLKVVVTLTQEDCFKKYMDFLLRKSDIELVNGTQIEIADINCTISKVLKNNQFEVVVQTGLVEKFACNLKWSREETDEEVSKLSDTVSCDQEKEECDFYISKSAFYQQILNVILKQHDLCECATCKDYVDLTKEHLKTGQNVFCSNNCEQTHLSALECYL